MTMLLVVEDDERISQPLIQLLRHEGFEVVHVSRGLDAIDAAQTESPDLVLLDLTLPDIDGLEVCRVIRQQSPTLPIVMLTARNQEVDVVVGLGAGADDYVTKPFRVGELVARVRARLRQAETVEAPQKAQGDTTAGVRVDSASRRAWLDGVEIALSPKEFDLLAYLTAHAGTTLRREQIMQEVWDEHWWGSTRTLDTHVAALRRKLGDSTNPPRFITTIRSVGLRFEQS